MHQKNSIRAPKSLALEHRRALTIMVVAVDVPTKVHAAPTGASTNLKRFKHATAWKQHAPPKYSIQIVLVQKSSSL